MGIHKWKAEGDWHLSSPTYRPGRLLDECNKLTGCRNDFQFAVKHGIDPATVSRIRAKKDYISPTVTIAIMDATGLALGELRRLAGITRKPLGDWNG